MQKENNVKTILLRGILSFSDSNEFDFKGPIKKGFRPTAWYDKARRGTSCSIISDIEIYPGEEKEVDIVLLNELELSVNVTRGVILKLGSMHKKIAEFTIEEHLGLWQGGKVP